MKRVNENKYISSFIGLAPFNNPSVVIAVVLDEPKGALRDGGQVSAPIFREIAEQILPELNIPPDEIVNQESPVEIKENGAKSIGSEKEESPVKDKKTKKEEVETKKTKDGKAAGSADRKKEPAETKNKKTGKGKT